MPDPKRPSEARDETEERRWKVYARIDGSRIQTPTKWDEEGGVPPPENTEDWELIEVAPCSELDTLRERLAWAEADRDAHRHLAEKNDERITELKAYIDSQPYHSDLQQAESREAALRERVAELEEREEHLLHGICDALDEGHPTEPILRALLKGSEHEHHNPLNQHQGEQE